MLKVLLIFIATLTFPKLSADSVITPAENAGIDGNSRLRLPFSEQHYRFQQIYFSPNLQALFHQEVLITELAFRLDGQYPVGQSFSTTAEGLSIRMSTTQAQPIPPNPEDPLPKPTGVFESNFGQDVSVVLPLRDLPLNGTKTSSTSFDVVIPLPQPFLYNPSAGNLLIDYQLDGISVAPFLDARGENNNPYHFSYNADLDAPAGFFAYTGLVTKFNFEVIPEPPPTSIIACGGILIWLMRKGRRE